MTGNGKRFETIVLTEQEEAALWRAFRANRDAKAREKIILRYAHYVKYVAGRLSVTMPDFVEYDDLVQMGIFGLIDAIEKYDPSKGIRFVTYAQQRIRGAILDGLRVIDWAPRQVRTRSRNLDRVMVALEQKLGRPPTDEEIAESLGVTDDELSSIWSDSKKSLVTSLDELSYEDDESTDSKYALVEDIAAKNPELRAETAETKRILVDAIGRLSEQERLVVTLYYYNDLTVKEISHIMNLSDSRISQLHTRAVLRLRGRLSRMSADLNT